MAARQHHGVTRGKPITLSVNGKTIDAFEGETLAAALLAGGVRHFRTDRDGQPRAPYCNMGTCFDCLVKDLDRSDRPWLRACLTAAEDGQRIATYDAADAPA